MLRQTSAALHHSEVNKLDGMRRIGFFEPYVWDQPYGNLRYISLLFEHIDRDRYEPVLLAPRHTRFSEVIAASQAPYVCLPPPKRLLLTGRKLLTGGLVGKGATLAALVLYNLRIASEIKRHKVDILQCNNLRAVLMAGLGARVSGRPVVWYVKSLLSEPALDWIGFRLASRVIFQDSRSRDRYSSLAASAEKLEVVRNGVDLEDVYAAGRRANEDLRCRLGLDPQRLNCVCMATLAPNKGIKYLLEAIARGQKNRKIALYLVGDTGEFPEHAAELRRFVSERGLKQVSFLGWRQDRLEILSLMDVFVLPSLSEDLPRSIMEAMALGKPVVATRVGGIPSMVEEGATGFLVPERDAASIADCLAALADSVELRGRMGQRARALAFERYSITRHVRELQSLYERVLPSGRAKQRMPESAQTG